jgi:hypothetical protein
VGDAHNLHAGGEVDSLLPRHVRTAVYDSELASFLYLKLRRRPVVGPDTDLVIEGFPRSANTFAAQAFVTTNPGRMVSSHTHGVGPLLRAQRLAVPAILLTREPLDAAASLVVREGISPRSALDWYVAFHKHAYSAADYVVVATFDQVVSNFQDVVRRVNERFNRQFVLPDLADQCLRVRVEAAVVRSERNFAGAVSPLKVGVPSRAREADLARARVGIEHDHPELLSEARGLFRQWRASAGNMDRHPGSHEGDCAP